MKSRNLMLILIIALSFLMFSCAERGEKDEDDSKVETVGWDAVYSQVLQSKCATCHSGGAPAAGLSWEKNQYKTIVTDGKMNSAGNMKIVTPGDSSNSFMYHKVSENNPSSGARMPLGGTLSQSSIDLIQKWIDSGAPETGTVAATTDSSSDSTTDNTTGNSTTTNSTNSIGWKTINKKYLTPICVPCHNDAMKSGGVSWVESNYKTIVTDGQKSSTGALLVKPKDSKSSYLVVKLEGGSGMSGGRMPLGGPYFTTDEISEIKKWIDEGAKEIGDVSGDPTANNTVTPEPTWEYITKYVFDSYCSLCHNNYFNYKNLSWAPDQYDVIVTNEKKSEEITTMKIVEPYIKEKSYLYLKITGDPSIQGSKMPGLGFSLNQTEVDLVGQWIDDGALPSKIYSTWESLEKSIFRVYCSGCHNNDSNMGNLSWSKDQYDTIVTNGKVGSDGSKIIVAGSKSASLLWKKINGTATNGMRMPMGLPKLSDAIITTIGEWIDSGAKKAPADNSTPVVTLPSGTGTSVTIQSNLYTWNDVQSTILQPKCVMCHSNSVPSAGLSWESDQYNTIINKVSATGVDLIITGDGAGSYLVKKLKGTGSGSRMPLGGPYLEQTDIDKFTLWIDAGAPEN